MAKNRKTRVKRPNRRNLLKNMKRIAKNQQVLLGLKINQ